MHSLESSREGLEERAQASVEIPEPDLRVRVAPRRILHVPDAKAQQQHVGLRRRRRQRTQRGHIEGRLPGERLQPPGQPQARTLAVASARGRPARGGGPKAPGRQRPAGRRDGQLLLKAAALRPVRRGAGLRDGALHRVVHAVPGVHCPRRPRASVQHRDDVEEDPARQGVAEDGDPRRRRRDPRQTEERLGGAQRRHVEVFLDAEGLLRRAHRPLVEGRRLLAQLHAHERTTGATRSHPAEET
mmetsp:Transcript_10001/g.29666  ORF Transcript_10001/g.29666 Transcript_10001/m.29666 type:complete len:244 (+) Transcript_10001:352-1083(+)